MIMIIIKLKDTLWEIFSLELNLIFFCLNLIPRKGRSDCGGCITREEAAV